MIKARINSTGEVVDVRPYRTTDRHYFMACRNGGIMGELYMRSELTIIGDKELEFIELVKKMREAQQGKETMESFAPEWDSVDSFKYDELRKEQKQLESEVDELIKEIEV